MLPEGICSSHENDRLLVKAERQHLILILKKNYTFLRHLAGYVIMLLSGKRAPRPVLGHSGPENKPEHPARLFVKFIGSHLAFTDEAAVGIGKAETVVSVHSPVGESVGTCSELHIETVVNAFPGILDSTPVRNHDTVISPFSFQNIIQKVLIMTTILALILVVGTHNGPGIAFLNCRLEGRKVDFVKCTVIHNDIHTVAVSLLIVQGKMFYTGSHTALLQIPDIRYAHLTCQHRVFAHILEIASTKRSSHYVHARSKQGGFIAVACLLSYALAEKGSHFLIPGGCKAGKGRVSSAGVIGPSGSAPVVPETFLAHP